MDCEKCHGWMEQRFHPKVYKKGKSDHKDQKEVNSMIDKKLQSNKGSTKGSTKGSKEKPAPPSRISQVIEEKCT